MESEKTTVPVYRRRFDPPSANPLVANPASPAVLQGLMQMLANCNQEMAALSKKVDALATRTPGEVRIAPALPEAKAPAEAAAEADTAVEPKPSRRRRLDRSKLLDFFD
jgi:hypothetical protein